MGAEVSEQLTVEQIDQVADGVVVQTTAGTLQARRVVVVAGPWVAEHERGTPTTARTRDHVIDPASRDRIVHYVEQWLPGLVPEVVAETTCLYTTTDDRDFVLDRVGDIVIASPCSGHGAKFAPAIGELLANLALTDTPTAPLFALHPRRSA